LQVFEDKNRRTRLRERLEEAPPGAERLLATGSPELGIAPDTDKRPQMALHPFSLRSLGHQGVDRCVEFRRRLRNGIRFENPRLCLDDLRERPEGDTRPVGERAALAPGNQLGSLLDRVKELSQEAGLANPGNADDRHELRLGPLTRPRECIDEQCALPLATHEVRALSLSEINAQARPCLHRLPHRYRLRLPLSLNGIDVAILDLLASRPECLLADEDAVDRRGRLHPGGRVHDVAGDHRLPELVSRVQIDERFAGVNGNAHLELGVLLACPVGDRQGGAYGALRVILVDLRGAEDPDDGVANELLHRPAEALDLVAQSCVVRPEHGADVLRIETFGSAGEADEVGKEDGDDLPLLAGTSTPRRGREPGAALGAELCRRRVLEAAGGAGHRRRCTG
jgi:hypothetical protein